jgi:hypothetical protein
LRQISDSSESEFRKIHEIVESKLG